MIQQRNGKGAVGVPAVTVRIAYALRRYTDGQTAVAVEAASVGEALAQVMEQFPPLRERLLGGGGRLHEHLAVFRNGDDVRDAAGLDTPVQPGDRIELFPPAAGG